MWIELFAPSSGRTWAISWFCKQQGHTASSTAESEVVAFADGLGANQEPEYSGDVVIALSAGVRHEALPIQMLLERMLGRRLPVRCRVDNDQCIGAIRRGYSKKLRALARTHRLSIGVMSEVCSNPEMQIEMLYVKSEQQKADIFTKSLAPKAFQANRSALGLRQQ